WRSSDMRDGVGIWGRVLSIGGGDRGWGWRTAAGETQRQQPAPNAWQVLKGVLFRIFIIWAISSWFRRGPAPQEQNSAGGTPRAPSRNLFPKDTLMDLYVYISEHEHFTDFNVSSALFWQKRDLVYGDWTSGENADGCYEHYGEVDISQSVQQNGSIYIHVYFTKSGFHPDPRQKNLYRRLATVHTSRMINKYKRRRFQKTKNLLTGETEADPEMIKRAEDYGPVEVISHWHPNLTINMVDDHTPWVKGSVPPPLDQYVKFDAVSGDYFPILYFNDYWNLQKDYFPINESLRRLPFRLSFCPLSLWRWQLYAAQSTKSPWNFLGEDLYEQSDEEQDSVKVALLETNPYLLALTIIVSIVHSVFEFLAFKNGPGTVAVWGHLGVSVGWSLTELRGHTGITLGLGSHWCHFGTTMGLGSHTTLGSHWYHCGAGVQHHYLGSHFGSHFGVPLKVRLPHHSPLPDSGPEPAPPHPIAPLPTLVLSPPPPVCPPPISPYSPHIPQYPPISPHISLPYPPKPSHIPPYLPVSPIIPHISSPYLHISPHIPQYPPISPPISPHIPP
uniref:CLPTM1 regulator of GABA type A receptor forward trafficking n=1 Tax=Coturnix japonica TaxID=93934 RepID=A0A8C2T4A0_COTJA